MITAGETKMVTTQHQLKFPFSAKEIAFTEPTKDCPHCHGKGIFNNAPCVCSYIVLLFSVMCSDHLDNIITESANRLPC